MSDKLSFGKCVPLKQAIVHNEMCKGCEKHRPVCNRVLFGGQPPADCPFVLEHIVGDQIDEAEKPE
jgi:hypothetical protein